MSMTSRLRSLRLTDKLTTMTALTTLKPYKLFICSSAYRSQCHAAQHNLLQSRRLRRLRLDAPRRDMSVYGFGQQWTGALSRGPSSLFEDEAPELSPEEIQQFGEYQKMVPLRGMGDGKKCIAAAAGWGHTALLVEEETDCDDDIKKRAAFDTGNKGDTKRKLLVCGRPHDFQTLLRLRRLPPFLRNFCIRYTLPDDTGENSQPTALLLPSLSQRIATYFMGDSETTIHEEKCRRYSHVPTLLEIHLPNGEIPAVGGEIIDNRAHESHATGKMMMREMEHSAPSQHHHLPSPSSFHTSFHDTLATSAGVTAVISKTGTLYTFGLNHRGQCGAGNFLPNIWTPSRVAGLASARFILDHGTNFGNDMFRLFKDQQHPIVSVSLGLQHGVALDSEGQVFCWGKGERGQLGQGRRMTFEESNDEDYKRKESDGAKGEVAHTENRTFDYALHVSNFHDPYATVPSSADRKAYAPLLSHEDSKVRLVAAGMNFTLAVTNSNLPYIWGKNVCLNPFYSESGLNSIRSKPVQDSTYPRYIHGLPPGLRIERVACGSHHAAMLLEDGSIWGVGVATDNTAPLWDEAVETLAAGVVNVNELISFTAGFDRTVAVSGDGRNGRRQVVEVQLWSDEELRLNGAVRPSWVDWLENDNTNEVIRSVHRGWLHSIIVTE